MAPIFRYFLGGSFSHFGDVWGNIWEIAPILGDLALFFRCLRYNLRIVTDIAIVGPRTLATAGA